MIKRSFLTVLVFLVACSRQLSEEIIDEKGLPMRLVPAGEFKMGTEQGQQQEGPVHSVYLDDFYIDKYEVTNGFYQACVEAGACDLPKSLEYYDDPRYQDHPVGYVDWYMASAYCEWRGGHLPTEAQWEFAARGKDERPYPWGFEPPSKKRTNFRGAYNRTKNKKAFRRRGQNNPIHRLKNRYRYLRLHCW